MLGLGLFRKGNLISEAGVFAFLFFLLLLEEGEVLSLGLQDGLFWYRFRLITASLVENECWLERKDDKHKRRAYGRAISGGKRQEKKNKKTQESKKGKEELSFFPSFFFAEHRGGRGSVGLPSSSYYSHGILPSPFRLDIFLILLEGESTTNRQGKNTSFFWPQNLSPRLLSAHPA